MSWIVRRCVFLIQNFVLKFNKEPEHKGKYQFKLILQMPKKRIETVNMIFNAEITSVWILPIFFPKVYIIPSYPQYPHF